MIIYDNYWSNALAYQSCQNTIDYQSYHNAINNITDI